MTHASGLTGPLGTTLMAIIGLLNASFVGVVLGVLSGDLWKGIVGGVITLAIEAWLAHHMKKALSARGADGAAGEDQ